MSTMWSNCKWCRLAARAWLDNMASLRLMKSSQNGSCDPEMAAAICNLRGVLANLDGPQWGTCALTFDAVVPRGQAVQNIWTQDSLISGRQVQEFKDKLFGPPTP